jgi:hypothetical protein
MADDFFFICLDGDELGNGDFFIIMGTRPDIDLSGFGVFARGTISDRRL